MSLHPGSLQFKTYLEYAFWMLSQIIQEAVQKCKAYQPQNTVHWDPWIYFDVLQCDGDDFENPGRNAEKLSDDVATL